MFDREARTGTDGALSPTFKAGAPAYLLDDLVTSDVDAETQHPADPRNTFFDGTLYVSNNGDAYNTVLINAQRPWSEATSSYDVAPDNQTPSDTDNVYCVMATVVNERTNVRLSVPLVNAIAGTVPDDGSPPDGRDTDD